MNKKDTYDGFEVGPIRPPSEAASLLLRVTRNCPWNKCKFCGLYKGEKFSIRPVSHVIKDIDLLKNIVDDIQRIMNEPEGDGGDASREIKKYQGRLSEPEWMAYHAALIK